MRDGDLIAVRGEPENSSPLRGMRRKAKETNVQTHPAEIGDDALADRMTIVSAPAGAASTDHRHHNAEIAVDHGASASPKSTAADATGTER